MDDVVLRALQRWPDVPACYGWVHLDARGRWRLGRGAGELVRHAGLAAFLSRNYSSNEHGEWFIQNGPQRAYVSLARTPFVLQLNGEGQLRTHTQQTVGTPTKALFGQDGNLYLLSEFGLSLVDDRDLPELLGKICDLDGNSADETDLLDLIDGRATVPHFLQLNELKLACNSLDTDALGQTFGFVESPPPTPASFELDQVPLI